MRQACTNMVFLWGRGRLPHDTFLGEEFTGIFHMLRGRTWRAWKSPEPCDLGCDLLFSPSLSFTFVLLVPDSECPILVCSSLSFLLHLGDK